MILDLVFEWQPGPRYPDELEAFRQTNIYKYVKNRFSENNILMSPDNIAYWQTLDQKALQKYHHLYIILHEQDLANASTLRTNPLRENNNLQSIILDISRIRITSPINHRIKNAVLDTISGLINASHGFVDEVKVLLGPEEEELEELLVSIVMKEMRIRPFWRRNIMVGFGHQMRLCVWTSPFR